MSSTPRLVLAPVAALVVGVLATGCEYDGASSLPLPGAVGTDGYAVSMTFTDATNLVVRETCRTNDVVVGTVESVELNDELQAEVVCRIRKDVALPANVRAMIRETSLLGERYVALDPPATEEPQGELAADTVIPVADTHVVPNVEVVFGALSQVLNGGGLASIETISRELATAFEGADLTATMGEIQHLVGTLDANRDEVVNALTSLNRLAGRLSRQRSVIATALDTVPDGLEALERQRPRLIRTVEALARLSDVALPLIRDSKATTVANLRDLEVVLRELATEKRLLTDAIEGIITFPFPTNSLATAQGDYAGMFATIGFDVDSFNRLLEQEGFGAPAAPTAPSSTPGGGLPDLPVLPQLPTLPQLPGLPGLPGLTDGLGGLLGDGSTTSQGGSLVPDLGSFGQVPSRRTGTREAAPDLAALLMGEVR